MCFLAAPLAAGKGTTIRVDHVRIFGSVESRGMSHAGIPLRMIALETTPAFLTS